MSGLGMICYKTVRKPPWGDFKLVTELCPTLCDPMDYTRLLSHGILQARILEWVAIPFSRRSSWPRDRTQVSCTAGRFFIVGATRETQMTLIKIWKEWANSLCQYLEKEHSRSVGEGKWAEAGKLVCLLHVQLRGSLEASRLEGNKALIWEQCDCVTPQTAHLFVNIHP